MQILFKEKSMMGLIQCTSKETVFFSSPALNTAAHVAAMNQHLHILRLIVANSFQMNSQLQNLQGNTPLHIASQRGNFQIILFLMMNGIDHTVKNKVGQKAGQTNVQSRLQVRIIRFISNVLAEQKAFDVLKPQHKKKLNQIFDNIDFDGTKLIDFQKAIRFNKYVEDVTESLAEKDAKDFIKACAVCNKQSVNIDQWHFAFSKLFVCDQQLFIQFLQDYSKAIERQGQHLKDFAI